MAQVIDRYVYVVWGNSPSTRTVLHAFAELEEAERFVERAERNWYDDDGNQHASPCEILEVKLSIEAIRIKERANG